MQRALAALVRLEAKGNDIHEMDSITHIALGAVIGEAVAGKTLGKRALIFGAAAQSLPDIDFVAAFWSTPVDNALAHRGFTHSLLFGIVAALVLAWMAARSHPTYDFSFKRWSFFFGLEIFIHLIIDAFNAYGVGWFEPFNSLRVSFHTLFVADPFFSVWIGISFFALILLKTSGGNRKRWAWFGLSMTLLYTAYAVVNKLTVNKDVKRSLRHYDISYDRFFTTPTPFNNWLWYVVVESDSGYHVAHHSVFDAVPKMDFHFFARDSSSLWQSNDLETTKKLLQFSQGYYTVEHWGDTLVFNDLRFGQIVGWHNPRERFVFHYFLNHPDDNTLVLQRGRFAKWNRETVGSLVKRIRGKKI